MAFNNINVSAGDVNRGAANVNNGLAEGLKTFAEGMDKLASGISQAELMRSFDVNKWQEVFKNAHPLSVPLAGNLAKIGMAHDEFQLETRKTNAQISAMELEQDLYRNHGGELAKALAESLGAVKSVTPNEPDRAMQDWLDAHGGAAGPFQEKPDYGTTEKTYWDPKTIADTIDRLKGPNGTPFPFTKDAMKDIAEAMMRGHANATTQLWRESTNDTRMGVAQLNNQTREDIAKGKPGLDDKKKADYNEKQRLAASNAGVPLTELVEDQSGYLQPPPSVQQYGGWEQYKANQSESRMRDRMLFERNTRIMLQNSAQAYESVKAQLAANHADSATLAKAQTSQFNDMRKQIESDMKPKKVYDPLAKDAKGNLGVAKEIPGDDPGMAYWRRLAPYAPDEIRNYSMAQLDENAFYAYLVKQFVTDADGKLSQGAGEAPEIVQAIERLRTGEVNPTGNPKVDNYMKAMKGVSVAKFRKFYSQAQKLDDLIPTGK